MRIDFDRPLFCRDCGHRVEVRLPVWVRPGEQEVDTSTVDYGASLDEWDFYCTGCGGMDLPIPQGEEKWRCLVCWEVVEPSGDVGETYNCPGCGRPMHAYFDGEE